MYALGKEIGRQWVGADDVEHWGLESRIPGLELELPPGNFWGNSPDTHPL